jgi:hypothetical protein
MKSRAHRGTDVNRVDASRLARVHEGQALFVGVDVGRFQLAVSSAQSRPELPGDQLQAPADECAAGERTERVNAGGAAKRRQRSAAGRAAGSRSALVVPTKQGNSPRRTLGREAERRPADPSAGNRGSTSRLRGLSTERARIASGAHPGWPSCRLKNRMR